jgi:methionine aminopeptidase
LVANSTLSVKGTLSISDTVSFGLPESTSKLVLEPGASLSIAIGAGIVDGSSYTDVSLTVSTTEADDATKATVTGSESPWTVTTLESGTGSTDTIVLGKIEFEFSDNAAAYAGAEADTAAAGSVTAGTGTRLTFAGAS